MKISSIVFIFSLLLFTSCVNNYETVIEVTYSGGEQKDTITVADFSTGPFAPVYQLDDGCLEKSEHYNSIVCDVRYFRILEQRVLE